MRARRKGQQQKPSGDRRAGELRGGGSVGWWEDRAHRPKDSVTY